MGADSCMAALPDSTHCEKLLYYVAWRATAVVPPAHRASRDSTRRRPGSSEADEGSPTCC